MTTAGGVFDAGNNMAAVATIFYRDADGYKTAMQSIEIPVTVIDRTIIRTLVSKTYDGDFEELAYTRTINPYEEPYSENFNDPNFSYYKRVRLVVRDGTFTKNIDYTLTPASYRIIDAATGVATNLKNLYTGRNVVVTLNYGETGATVARDTKITTTIDVTIADMTYASGLTEAYYIDPYGIKTDVANPAYDPKYAQSVVYSDGTHTIITESGLQYTCEVTFDPSDLGNVYNGKKRVALDYTGGVSRLYARIGNELGGVQTIVIPVYYENRTITKLFESAEAPYFVGEADQRATSYFKFDPFKIYSVEQCYPQAGNITFYSAEGSQIYGSFANSPDSPIKVVWDDSKVKINYKGSDDSIVVAHISAADGSYAQKIAFNVKVLNRTVTGYTNVLKNPDIIIKPYQYNSSENVTRDVVNDIFTTGQFTVHFGGYDPADPSTRNPDMPSITFTMGSTAQYHTVDGEDKLPFADESEKNLRIEFRMDTARPLSYKGKDARFYVTIPGFGMGEKGQQWASIDVPVEEQYILQVWYMHNSQAYSNLVDWAKAKYGSGAIDHLILRKNAQFSASNNPLLYDIQTPYFFINMGGFELPTDIRIGVGPKGGTYEQDGNYPTGYKVTYQYINEEGNTVTETKAATAPYSVEVYWSNTASNKLRIYYNKETVKTSFQMDLDNQSFNLTFNVTPWVLNDPELFSESTTYGKEEVIYLPGSPKNSSILTLSTTNITNDTYILNYPNVYLEEPVGQRHGTLRIERVTGGGSFMDYVNKWNFESVEFETTGRQSAVLMLGGRGGQVVKWSFMVANKILIGNTIPTSYALQLGGPSVNLPTTYRQIFAGYDYRSSKEIPITYGEFTSFVVEYETDDDGNYITDGNGNRIVKQNTGVQYSLSNNRVTAAHITPAKLREESDSNPRYYPAYIEWDADSSARVYPNPNKSIGSKIIFTCYDWVSQEATNTYGIYLHNPAATFCDDLINPGTDENWKYPSDMPTIPDASFVSDGRSYIVPANSTYYHYLPSGNPQQSNIPIIKLNKNAKFDLRYLPTMSYRYFKEAYYESTGNWWDDLWGNNEEKYVPAVTWDNVYVAPWENAQVYWTDDWGSQWKPRLGQYGNPLSNGFRDIDTSKEGRRYTLKVDVKGGTLVVAIDILYGSQEA